MAPVPNHLPPAGVCGASFPGPMLPHLAPSQLQLVWHLSIFTSVISHPPPHRPRTYGTSASYLQNWQRQSHVVFPQLLSIGFLFEKHRMGINGERRLNPTRDKSSELAGTTFDKTPGEAGWQHRCIRFTLNLGSSPSMKQMH